MVARNNPPEKMMMPSNRHVLEVRESKELFASIWRRDLDRVYAILDPVRSPASRVIGTLALLTCLICPVLEPFDNWDPPSQTGNDTEYTLGLLHCAWAQLICLRAPC